MVEKRYIDEFGQLLVSRALSRTILIGTSARLVFLLRLSQEVIRDPAEVSLSLIQLAELISEKKSSDI